MYHQSVVVLMLIAMSITTLPVQGQLSVFWNGSAVTRPSLIFLDELLVDDYSTAKIGVRSRPGALICISNRARVSWHFVNGSIVSDAPRTEPSAIIQTRTGAGVTPSVSRLSVSMEGFASSDGHINGVWHCRLNAVDNNDYEAEVNVGIYSRGQERGRISRVGVELGAPSAPFTFTLRGYSLGGPPTIYFWTRNNEVIINDGMHSISTGVNSTDIEAYEQAIYVSLLTVTEGLPGVYTYSATNRISPRALEQSITIQRGQQPDNLAAEQNGFTTVLVSWEAPPLLPTLGYRVTAEPGNFRIDVQSSPATLSVQKAGDYRVAVVSIAYPIPSEPVGVEVTVTGIAKPAVGILSLTTSVEVFWTMAINTLPPTGYTLLLFRVTGMDQMLCQDFEDRRRVELNSSTIMKKFDNLLDYEFAGLQEFSVYMITVIANFSLFDQFRSLPADGSFLTISAVPTGAPGNVTVSNTPQSINVSWEPIECIERNGFIIIYNVELKTLSGDDVTGSVAGRTFTASGLSPNTEYIFRVAGINKNGQGPFSKPFTISTAEDIPGPVSNLTTETFFTSVLISWDPPARNLGVITAYEVFYRINGDDLNAVNTTDISTAHSFFLDRNTSLSSISVLAYTSAGPGPAAVHPDVQIPEHPVLPAVSGVIVEMLDDTSVMVSWEIFLIPEIVNYTVYFRPADAEVMRNESEEAVTVSSMENSVVIEDLTIDVEYQFQVAATAELDGRLFPGERSSALAPTAPTTPSPTTAPQTIANTATLATVSSPVTVPPPNSFLQALVTGGVAGAMAVLLTATVSLFLWLTLRDFKSLRIWETRFSNPILSHYIREQSKAADIVVFPSNYVHAIKGEGVIFRALALGAPPLSVTWYHDNTPLKANRFISMKENGSLFIRHAQLRHNGMYRMVAQNNRGRAEREVRLIVTEHSSQRRSASTRESEELSSFELETSTTSCESSEGLLKTMSSSDVRSVASTWESELLYPRASGMISPSGRTIQLSTCSFDMGSTVHKQWSMLSVASAQESIVPVANFSDYVARGHADNDRIFRHQFNRLDTRDTIGTSVESLESDDQNRIFLKPLKGFVECQGEFINACYLHGHCKPGKFIAAQGPNEHMLFIDFWRLIWQEKPSIVIMLTGIREERNKCEQYWPKRGSGSLGPFTITLTEEKVFSDHCVRTMQIATEDLKLQSGSARTHKVSQFQYTAWPEQGVPEDPASIVAFYRKVMSEHKRRDSPILVHCSAGMGVFICLDNVLEQIRKDQLVDIAETVKKMKYQHTKMIQTLEQYVFIHNAVLDTIAYEERVLKSKAMLQDMLGNQLLLQTQFEDLGRLQSHTSGTTYSGKGHAILNREFPDYTSAVSASSYRQRNAFIIAEGPTKSTVKNMWNVIANRECDVVVMLSNLSENGQKCCWQYWPTAEKTSVKFGKHVVELDGEKILKGYTIRKLRLKQRGVSYLVTQFHITCWAPDGWCSNLKSIVDVIEELAKRTSNKPVFIHCSDTVTRSGMFCAMAIEIERCKREGVVDVFQAVHMLRSYKPGAVPTKENYQTVYETILTSLDNYFLIPIGFT